MQSKQNTYFCSLYLIKNICTRCSKSGKTYFYYRTSDCALNYNIFKRRGKDCLMSNVTNGTRKNQQDGIQFTEKKKNQHIYGFEMKPLSISAVVCFATRASASISIIATTISIFCFCLVRPCGNTRLSVKKHGEDNREGPIPGKQWSSQIW